MKTIASLGLLTILVQSVACGESAHAQASSGTGAKAGPSDRSIRFSEQLIADRYAYAYGIAAADLDLDGDLDLTSADYTPHNCVYHFENDGGGAFTRHFLQRDDPERIERHVLADLNKDGFPDLVIVKNKRGHLLWFANPAPPKAGTLWARHVITTDLPGAYDVDVADLDGDGDLDVAASSWILGNQFAWFENAGTDRSGPWTKHMIEADIAETRTVRVADFDGDGDPDLLGTALGPGEVILYENLRIADGDGVGVAWKKHVIGRAPRPTHGNPVDMDGDGDIDVVMAMGMALPAESNGTHRVVWYENPGGPIQGEWVSHLVSDDFPDAFETVGSDLDGDGDVDVAATSWRSPGSVVWIENHGDPRGAWTRHTLKDDWRSANQIIVADLNGDGRPDLVACAERGSNEVRWWKNEGRPPGL